MKAGSFEKLGDDVELDETFVGGLAKNMHRDVRERKITGTGVSGKTVVLGFLERGGDVRAMVTRDRSQYTLNPAVRENVLEGSRLYTDAWLGYKHMRNWFRHEFVDHAVEYVQNQCHTNGLENFWSLLYRSLKGTYVSVQPYHLNRYLDEQCFRYNERRMDDPARFNKVMGGTVGKRITYRQLTGKEDMAQA